MMAIRGVDLRWVGTDALGLDNNKSHWYGNSGGPELARIVHSVRRFPNERALDIGCGKGGAVITLSQFFPWVDGVEISPILAAIARKNLHRLRIKNVGVFVSDAALFEDLDQYTFIYMYNPFPAPVFRAVVDNLRSSLGRQPRSLRLLYKNAECHSLSVTFCRPLTKLLHTTHSFPANGKPGTHHNRPNARLFSHAADLAPVPRLRTFADFACLTSISKS